MNVLPVALQQLVQAVDACAQAGEALGVQCGLDQQDRHAQVLGAREQLGAAALDGAPVRPLGRGLGDHAVTARRLRGLGQLDERGVIGQIRPARRLDRDRLEQATYVDG